MVMTLLSNLSIAVGISSTMTEKILFTVQNHHDYNSRSLITVFNNEITIKELYMKIPRPKSEVNFTYFCMGHGRIPVDINAIQTDVESKSIDRSSRGYFSEKEGRLHYCSLGKGLLKLFP